MERFRQQKALGLLVLLLVSNLQDSGISFVLPSSKFRGERGSDGALHKVCKHQVVTLLGLLFVICAKQGVENANSFTRQDSRLIR